MNTSQRPQFTHLADVYQRPAFLRKWERVRHKEVHWFVECAAEFMAVFLYCFAGIGSTAPYVLGNLAGQSISSLFQIGCAYAIGIVLALVICSSTSGGHFSPGVTITYMVFRGFPVKRGLRYIVAQILGAYIACLLIYVQYHHLIVTTEAALEAKGALDAINFTAAGPAGIFALYVAPGSKLGEVFVNEFVCDFVIGLTIWAILDPTNFMVSPVAGPWIIAFTYAMAVWGYAPAGLAANSARDVGGRLMALTIWGRKAGGGPYAAIAALTNIPASLLAAAFYEVFLTDTSRVLNPAIAEMLSGQMAHAEHSRGVMEGTASSGSSLDEKVSPDVAVERA